MKKNTHHVLVPANDSTPKVKKNEEPSRMVIENILNYSKALKVEQCRDGRNFVEYIIN